MIQEDLGGIPYLEVLKSEIQVSLFVRSGCACSLVRCDCSSNSCSSICFLEPTIYIIVGKAEAQERTA